MRLETEDQLRQYFNDATATVDDVPDLVTKAVRTGKARLRKRRAAVGGALSAAVVVSVLVPIIQPAFNARQNESNPAASTVSALPQIATSTWRQGDDGLFARLHATLNLSSDGRCFVVGDHDLVVWPADYTVVLRDGRITVLDETGAEAARVGDLITAGGGQGDVPANGCGLSSAFHIQSQVNSTRP